MDTATDRLRLVAAALDDPLAVVLVEELQQEYVVRYGGTDATPTEPAQFAPPGGGFWLLLDGEDAVGCAGLRRHDPATAELKRMYLRPTTRRRGVSKLLLAAVEDAARAMGYRRIVLETGQAQPEALALYAGAGYLPTEPFGRYACAPGAHHLAKSL